MEAPHLIRNLISFQFPSHLSDMHRPCPLSLFIPHSIIRRYERFHAFWSQSQLTIASRSGFRTRGVMKVGHMVVKGFTCGFSKLGTVFGLG